MAHVFIVDDKSFPTHLLYSFAGTGAKEYSCEFLADEGIRPFGNVERLLTGMISDISRLRVGDDVLFYLQQTTKHEGLFFGCFKVASKPFLASDNYLKDELGKNLTFRVFLEPHNVYPIGATERDCLDSLDGITHPSDMCWSLIYRKLKGNRGCTMITDAEFNHIVNKIKRNNAESYEDGSFTYDEDNCKIQTISNGLTYNGLESPLDITSRLYFKYNNRNAYESHLQAYILQNLENIKELRAQSDAPINWIGNEVSCGVGMQSIDILFTQEDDDSVDIIVCELKDEQIQPYIQAQIKKYIEWISDYLAPTYHKNVIIHPTIVAPTPNDKSLQLFESFKNSFTGSDKVTIAPVRYIGFDIGEEIVFKAV